VKLNDILEKGVELDASDVHLKTGSVPLFRIRGDIERSNLDALTRKDFENLLSDLNLNDYMLKKLEMERQIDIGHGVPGVGRFRVNIFYQRGTLAGIFRYIPYDIPSIESLNLPKVIKKISLRPRGLVLVTGITGSGKTTTLASMIDIINKTKKKNIITIEDPIEYLHKDEQSSIVQRQVGYDATNFASGLKGALREDPDVMLIGEMRDRETISTAIEAVETGHLVMSTLHTLDAVETVNRIISSFPLDEQQQIRIQLSTTIEAVISQRLIEKADESGMVPAVEVMIASDFIRDAIKDSKRTNSDIKRSIEMNRDTYGTQSFDQSLIDLFNLKLITKDKALEYASNPSDLQLKMRGIM